MKSSRTRPGYKMKDEMLEKEKKISDSVKELRKQLVEREAVLYSFDEYEKIRNEIDKLNAEIELIKSTPFYDNTKEPLGSHKVFCMPHAIYELPVQEYHIDNKGTYYVGNNYNYSYGIPINTINSVPEKTELRPVMSRIIIQNAFKDFMIKVRKEYVKELEKKLEEILAGIDSEIIDIGK